MIQTPSSSGRRPDGIVAPLKGPVREPFRVRVAHGVPLIASGISAVLANASEIVVLGTFPNTAMDVLVADAETGLRAAGSGVRKVLIIAHDDGEALIRNALEKGVRGFLLHTCAPEELTNAVKTVARGGTAFAPCVTSRIAQTFATDALTEREQQVLHLMVHGLSDKDMARQLLIAVGTVKSHMKAILTKLGAARRTEAAAIAQRRGLARLDFDVATAQGLRPLGADRLDADAAAVFFNASPVSSRPRDGTYAR